MPRRKKLQQPLAAQKPETIAAAVDTVIEQATQNVEAPPTEQEPEKPKKRFEPLAPNPGFGGETHALPDGTIARLKDYGNREGVGVQFALPEGVERPAPEALAHLKSYRQGHTSFQYKGDGHWHKRLSGPGLNPEAERDDATDRFRKAVQAQREAREGQEQGEGPGV